MPDYFDRDLSWLSFNYRVLMEARREDVPLLERLRFLAIYSSNLDEFSRVRVSEVRRLATLNKKKINKSLDFEPVELLKAIRQTVASQLEDYGETLQQVHAALAAQQVVIALEMSQLGEAERQELRFYFRSRVLAYLKPFFFSEDQGAPFLNNQALYFAFRIKKNTKVYSGYVNIPSDKLPRFYRLCCNKKTFFIYLDDIIRLHADLLFKDAEIVELKSIKLNKNADLNIEDEYSGDLVKKISKQIQKRNLGEPSRFLYDETLSDELLSTFREALSLSESDCVRGGRYHNLSDFWQITLPDRPELSYAPQPPLRHRLLDSHPTIFSAIEARDQLLHFPYQSYDYVLQFFNEAATDPEVEAIKVAFYRMAKDSLIAEALISAAHNGKAVTVFIEVKARFDEANNLLWAERFQKAGVNVVYSIPGLKVHAKIALVQKADRKYAFLGTGNLNEKTAAIYADYGLLTCREKFVEELRQVFRFLHKRKMPKMPFERLIVSQFNALETFETLIEEEIRHQQNGDPAEIIIKVNNLQERSLIRALYRAAEAGVRVRVLARSICCLVPETKGIKVYRLVGRYLEHARLFYFRHGGEDRLYMGSSDWMNRNLHRRIEVTVPVLNADCKAELLHILRLQLRDNTQLVRLGSDLKNYYVTHNEDEPATSAQSDTYQWLASQNTD